MVRKVQAFNGVIVVELEGIKFYFLTIFLFIRAINFEESKQKMKPPKNEEEPNKVKLPRESNYITISVVSGPETIEKFKVKKNEALLDVMMSVSFDIGRSLASLGFAYNRGIVNKEDTPSTLGLKDEEELFVFLEHPLEIYEYIYQFLFEAN